VPAAGDRSVEIHACHGRARQVEVLRDAILHLLRDDPTLEPRDVIVMCPDIETFAPLIHATFGAPRPTRTASRPARGA
jgi:exodeoxyribonuclease V gamma subunit